MTGSGAPIFVRERSAIPLNTNLPIAILFVESGSGVLLETVAVSFTSTGSEDVICTVMTVRPPAGSVPRLQVTVLPTIPHGLAAGGENIAVIIVKAPLLKCESVTTTFLASEAPKLSTKIVHVAVLPVGAGPSGLHSLVSRRSA